MKALPSSGFSPQQGRPLRRRAISSRKTQSGVRTRKPNALGDGKNAASHEYATAQGANGTRIRLSSHDCLGRFERRIGRQAANPGCKPIKALLLKIVPQPVRFIEFQSPVILLPFAFNAGQFGPHGK